MKLILAIFSLFSGIAGLIITTSVNNRESAYFSLLNDANLVYIGSEDQIKTTVDSLDFENNCDIPYPRYRLKNGDANILYNLVVFDPNNKRIEPNDRLWNLKQIDSIVKTTGYPPNLNFQVFKRTSPLIIFKNYGQTSARDLDFKLERLDFSQWTVLKSPGPAPTKFEGLREKDIVIQLAVNTFWSFPWPDSTKFRVSFQYKTASSTTKKQVFEVVYFLPSTEIVCKRLQG